MKFKPAAILSLFAGTLVLMTGALAGPTVWPTGVTVHEEGVSDGYLVFDSGDIQHLVDIHGNEVHQWLPGCRANGPARPVPGGHILIVSCANNLVEMDWDSTFVWQFAPPPGVVFHHDWERLSNGNTLILCRQDIVDPSISPLSIRDDFIIEVTPAGEIVWEWHTPDHFDELGLSQERIDLIYELGGDWSHINTASAIPDNTSHTDPRFRPGNIVLSIRAQNTIIIVDRDTSEIAWILTDGTRGQHTTHMLSDDLPGAGNILAYDNGQGAWVAVPNRYYSRVVEIDPLTNTFPWIYTAEDSGYPKETFFSSLTSGVQRMSNGNTVIFESKWGRVFEVTDTGQLVWEYISPFIDDTSTGSNRFYRAYKVPLDWAGPHFVPDLAVSMDGNPDPSQVGQDIDYAIQVENVGPEPAVSVELSQSTPAGTTFRSVSAPAGWSCSTPAVGSTGPISCTGSSLGAGEAAAFTMVVEADLCHVDGASITSTATVSSLGSDSVPGNNTATVVTTGASDALVSDLAVDLANAGSDVRLDWGDWAPGCGYHVLRSTAPGGGFVDMSGLHASNTYTDNGVGAGPESYYYLISID